MNASNTCDYYRRRAAQAAALAGAATMPGVRSIHSEMAKRYAALAEAGDAQQRRPELTRA